jgi:predicted nucleotide-binding protein
MGIFDAASDRCTVVVPEAPAVRPRVFIGHGHSDQWKLLYQHLGDVHHFEVQAFESGSRAGHTIRDILEGLLESTDIALLVMTGEDAQPNTDLMRARQNVVHETGLFQGRLGFARGVILLEEGTEPFTNVDGIQYIPFAKGNIRETFGDVLGLLRREFGGL